MGGDLCGWDLAIPDQPHWEVNDYVWRGASLLAVESFDGDTNHFHLDHLGTPRLVTGPMLDEPAAVVAYHAYQPFGEEVTATNQDREVMKFTGHERDLRSTPTQTADDLDYMHARACSPLTGRFLSVDTVGGRPMAPQSWNRYSYVLGNPTRYVDPTGLVLARAPNAQEQGKCDGVFSCIGRWIRKVLNSDPLGLTSLGNPIGVVGGAVKAAPALAKVGRGALGMAKAGARAASVVAHGPMNPGPLAEDVVATFRSGTYAATTLKSPRVVYRVLGEAGSETGNFWTAAEPSGPLQAVVDLALDPKWGNTATRTIAAETPAGTTIYEGLAAAQGGLVGGGSQIYIPVVERAWLLP